MSISTADLDRAGLLAEIRALAPELVAVMPDFAATPTEQLRTIHADVTGAAAMFTAAGSAREDDGERG